MNARRSVATATASRHGLGPGREWFASSNAPIGPFQKTVPAPTSDLFGVQRRRNVRADVQPHHRRQGRQRPSSGHLVPAHRPPKCVRRATRSTGSSSDACAPRPRSRRPAISPRASATSSSRCTSEVRRRRVPSSRLEEREAHRAARSRIASASGDHAAWITADLVADTLAPPMHGHKRAYGVVSAASRRNTLDLALQQQAGSAIIDPLRGDAHSVEACDRDGQLQTRRRRRPRPRVGQLLARARLIVCRSRPGSKRMFSSSSELARRRRADTTALLFDFWPDVVPDATAITGSSEQLRPAAAPTGCHRQTSWVRPLRASQVCADDESVRAPRSRNAAGSSARAARIRRVVGDRPRSSDSPFSGTLKSTADEDPASRAVRPDPRDRSHCQDSRAPTSDTRSSELGWSSPTRCRTKPTTFDHPCRP